jgi:hypothetical protein
MRQIIVFALLLLCLCNCTAIGAGIGGAIPRYATVPEIETAVGQETKLYDSKGALVAHGTLIAADNVSFDLHDGQRRIKVLRDEVATVKKRNGSYWEVGAGLGLTIDIPLAIAAAFYGLGALSMSNMRWNWGGSWGAYR